jgi:hypothetical protein
MRDTSIKIIARVPATIGTDLGTKEKSVRTLSVNNKIIVIAVDKQRAITSSNEELAYFPAYRENP